MLEAGYKLLDFLTTFWNYYLVVTGVILGWLFSATVPWPIPQKILVTFLFVAFALVSLDGLQRTYRALDVTSSELHVKWEADAPFKKAILGWLSQKRWRWAIFLHVIADVIVIFCIWRVNKRST